MTFDPLIAEIRFGTGLSPTLQPSLSTDAMLSRLLWPDAAATTYPIRPWTDHLPILTAFRDLRRDIKTKALSAEEGRAADKAMRQDAKTKGLLDLRSHIARHTMSNDGFRERLVQFWANHFTAFGKTGMMRFSGLGYVEEAIRPHIAGRFADILKAAVTHPLMLHYLDQARSIGPNSVVGLARGRGLNENLAREVIELHTLGVGAPYTQNDVRELAELFTGMNVSHEKGFRFRHVTVEPGAETILGVEYGGGIPSMQPIYDVLDNLAVHPATAQHIARKLAMHFVADKPDRRLVDHIARAYSHSGGALLPTYQALLEHPASWQIPGQKARQPFDFVVAAIRALGVPAQRLTTLKPKQLRRIFSRAFIAMGQNYGRPPGPDGWPEDATYWVTPQGLTARIEWSMKMPERLMRPLPDPRLFVHQALGGRASPQLQFAAGAAETRTAGIGIVLVSPEFQRR